MPSIRSISIADDSVSFVDSRGVTKTFSASSIPQTQNTTAKVENYINGTWIPENVTDYQMRVHVFSLNPLRVTVGTWELGASIPANWWDL